jgi:hypothetical protein
MIAEWEGVLPGRAFVTAKLWRSAKRMRRKRLSSEEKGRSSAKSDPEETMHKIRGKSSIESNVFDPPRAGEIRKPDIMDKYNEYAGKEGSRSVDAKIVRRSTKPVAEFPRCE